MDLIQQSNKVVFDLKTSYKFAYKVAGGSFNEIPGTESFDRVAPLLDYVMHDERTESFVLNALEGRSDLVECAVLMYEYFEMESSDPTWFAALEQPKKTMRKMYTREREISMDTEAVITYLKAHPDSKKRLEDLQEKQRKIEYDSQQSVRSAEETRVENLYRQWVSLDKMREAGRFDKYMERVSNDNN